jgi:serine/threonine-protein kinase
VEPAIAKKLQPNERRFGRYELLYRLASGGMANIYVARFLGVEGFEKLLAIKRIHDHLTEDPQFIKMFFDEARVASRIMHPNVVQVIELGEVDGVYFMAMEYVHGESLSSVLWRVKLHPRVCAKIVADAAAGLHGAHQLCDAGGRPLNVVHRDVSPQNILLSYDGAVKVTDFGVARARDNAQSTAGSSLKGKFSYMSPEQASAEPVDRRSDVFALGIVLYELTTRTRLFKGSSSVQTLRKVTSQVIPPPSQFITGYPKQLEQVVLSALERNPARRLQSAEQLQHELERFLAASGDPVLPSRVGTFMARSFADRIDEKRKMLLGLRARDLGEQSGNRPPSSAAADDDHQRDAVCADRRGRLGLRLAAVVRHGRSDPTEGFDLGEDQAHIGGDLGRRPTGGQSIRGPAARQRDRAPGARRGRGIRAAGVHRDALREQSSHHRAEQERVDGARLWRRCGCGGTRSRCGRGNGGAGCRWRGHPGAAGG